MVVLVDCDYLSLFSRSTVSKIFLMFKLRYQLKLKYKEKWDDEMQNVLLI